MKKDALILGLGSNILTDAGVGIHLLNDIKSTGLIANVDFETDFLMSLEILELINNYKTLVIIDGVKSGKDPIGKVRVFSLADFFPTIHLSNFHDFEFSQIIELGEFLGLNMPKNIQVISIEVQDNLTFSNNLSTELAAQYPDVKSKVINQIKDIIQSTVFVN